jgi:membrane-associated phospholipid phosphatase
MRGDRKLYCLYGITLLMVMLSATSTLGQTLPTPTPSPTASTEPSLEKQFFRNILRDQKAIWTSPFHLERADAKWMVPSFLGTMALFTTDRMTGDEVAEFDDLHSTSKILSYPGSIYAAGATAASFYIVGRVNNDDRARETGILAAEASIDTSIAVFALKEATNRVRPRDGHDRSEFWDGGSSFPSGHSAEAWTLATIIANEYHDHKVVQVAAYSLAGAVSAARFTGGKHYISDAVVGSALGYGIGKYVYSTHHRKESDDDDSQSGLSRWPSFGPQFNRHAHEYGIALRWNF